MSLFRPKYPTSDTPGATATPAKRESRGDRKLREQQEWLDADLKDRFRAAEEASKERSGRFWDDYERRNGPGSVDYS